jgi:hypothetical protein
MKRKASNKKKQKKTKELAVFSCRDSAYETLLVFISKDAEGGELENYWLNI